MDEQFLKFFRKKPLPWLLGPSFLHWVEALGWGQGSAQVALFLYECDPPCDNLLLLVCARAAPLLARPVCVCVCEREREREREDMLRVCDIERE